MQPDEVEHFVDLGQPAGGEKKKAAGRLAAAFRERSFGRRNDRAFPKLTENKSGTGACFPCREIVDARRKVEGGGGSRRRQFECENSPMKKLLAVLVVALVTAATVWVLGRIQLAKRLATVPELLPETTLALIEVPDFQRARAQWQRSDLYQIWREPSVQAWLQKPLATVADRIVRAVARCWKIFSSSGRPTVCRADLAREQRTESLSAAFISTIARPEAADLHRAAKGDLAGQKRRSRNAKRRVYRAAPDRDGERFAFRFRDAFTYDHWFFAANDVATLKALLDRAASSQAGKRRHCQDNATFMAASKASCLAELCGDDFS